MMTITTNNKLLRLTTYGIHHGIATCRIEISPDGEHWDHWALDHVLAHSWYLLILECKAAFGDRVEIIGIEKLQEWRQSFNLIPAETTDQIKVE